MISSRILTLEHSPQTSFLFIHYTFKVGQNLIRICCNKEHKIIGFAIGNENNQLNVEKSGADWQARLKSVNGSM